MNRLYLGIGLVVAGVIVAATIWYSWWGFYLSVVTIAFCAIAAYHLWIAWGEEEPTLIVTTDRRPAESSSAETKVDSRDGDISRASATGIAVVVLSLGTAVFVGLPLLLITLSGFSFTAAWVVTQITGAAWLLWLTIEGVRIIPKPDFWVVERFGQYMVTKKPGFRFFLLLGLVDKVVMKNTSALQRFKLYQGDQEAEIDFADGSSAPVRGDCWFKIVDPVKWTYAYNEGEPEVRVQQIVDGFIRPKLQALTISEARTEQTEEKEAGKSKGLGKLLAEDTGEGSVEEALKEIGVELDENKPFILSDIIISKEIQDALREKLVAEILADADKLRASGVHQAVEDILVNARKTRAGITYQDAVKIFLERTTLQTLEKIAANGKVDFSFVAPDMGGVVKTFGVSDANAQTQTQGGNT